MKVLRKMQQTIKKMSQFITGASQIFSHVQKSKAAKSGLSKKADRMDADNRYGVICQKVSEFQLRMLFRLRSLQGGPFHAG